MRRESRPHSGPAAPVAPQLFRGRHFGRRPAQVILLGHPTLQIGYEYSELIILIFLNICLYLIYHNCNSSYRINTNGIDIIDISLR